MKKAIAVVSLAVALSTGLAMDAGAEWLGRCRMQLTEYRSQIGVRYVLRTPTAGRSWRFRILDEGVRVFRKVYTTDENGDFVARVRIPRLPGFRRYDGVATDLVTRDSCRIRLRT
jgi:hypothetical protein